MYQRKRNSGEDSWQSGEFILIKLGKPTRTSSLGRDTLAEDILKGAYRGKVLPFRLRGLSSIDLLVTLSIEEAGGRKLYTGE